MEKNQLIPPSHFEVDSLESSPSIRREQKPLLTDSVVSPAGGIKRNVVLQTPDDFKLNALQQHSSVLDDNFGSGDASENHHYALYHHSQGATHSGLEHRSHKDISDKENDHYALKLLKDENERLCKLLHTTNMFKIPQTQESAASKCDVITHQVQFIERLKQDIVKLSDTVHMREQEVCEGKTKVEEEKRQRMLFEKDVEKLREDLGLQAVSKKELESLVSNLQSEITKMTQSTIDMQNRHEADLQSIQKQHLDNVRQIEANEQTVRDAMKKAFDQEEFSWKEQLSEIKQECDEKIQVMSDEHKNQVHELALQAKDEQLQLTNETTKFHTKFQEMLENEDKMRNKIDELTLQLQDANQTLLEKHTEIEMLSNDLNAERETVLKLKTYVAKIQADDLARSQWQEDQKNMRNEINAIEQEKAELTKTLELLNVRFQSVSKILEMQEASIAAHTTAIPDPISQNKAGVVTQQWRAKVFELMVQCKSQEIITKEEEAKHQIVVNALRSQLEDEERQCAILTSKVKDVDAQLQLKSYTCQTLASNNEELKQKMEFLKAKLSEQESDIAGLFECVRNVSGECEMSYQSNFTQCMQRCLRLEQRLAFANNRLRTIQDLLVRKETVWRMRLQKASNSTASVIPEKETQERPDLSSEVIRLTGERDMLSQRLAHDASSFERTTADLNRQIDDLKRVSHEQEKSAIKQEEIISDLNEKIKILEGDLGDFKSEKEISVEELRQVKEHRDKDIEAAVSEANLKHSEEMQQQELKLNKVKRELTKTVVSLRQVERTSTREKLRFTDQLELERQSWMKEEQKLKGAIRELQKDNNLIMTTLRQEGLVASYKAARGKPVLQPEDPPAKHVHFPQENLPGKGDAASSADVDRLLQDLTNLSEKVLAESESD